jgi:hypothetical protein
VCYSYSQVYHTEIANGARSNNYSVYRFDLYIYKKFLRK